MKTILKAGWQRKTGFLGYVPSFHSFTLSWIFGAGGNSNVLPIMFNMRRPEITNSYRKFFSLYFSDIIWHYLGSGYLRDYFFIMK